MDKTKKSPTLEKAVQVLEEAGFRVFDITHRPKADPGQRMGEALEKGCGVISLCITPREDSNEKPGAILDPL
jgi:hypothetical protein